jgi:hypothetical protein
MSREATVLTHGARPPLALPEKPKRECRAKQRSKAGKTARGMFHADPSEEERITDFGVHAEVQSDCGCLAGSFDKIAYAAGRRGGCGGGLLLGRDPAIPLSESSLAPFVKTTPERDAAQNTRRASANFPS